MTKLWGGGDIMIIVLTKKFATISTFGCHIKPNAGNRFPIANVGAGNSF